MNVIKRGTRRVEDTVLLQELLTEAGFEVTIDGTFGAGLERQVCDFQAANGLVADGVVGSKTWMKLSSLYPEYFEELSGRFLSEKNLIAAADELRVDLGAIKAVREVEARGTGFLGRRPRILFEGHVFWKRLQKHGLDPEEYRDGNRDLLYRTWTTTHYLGGVREYDRLERARAIHADAARESASWGMFQVMGYHWQRLGYRNIAEFVRRMRKNEGEHLEAFARFIAKENLVRYLRAHDWPRFARGYNGSGYRKNRYDEKLAAAYRRHS